MEQVLTQLAQTGALGVMLAALLRWGLPWTVRQVADLQGNVNQIARAAEKLTDAAASLTAAAERMTALVDRLSQK